MKVINFFGGPGMGKSTASAGLFYLMKRHNLNCEYVTEYAKELVWEERFNILEGDQLYILARQHRHIDRLRGKVDYVVTDSPLLLSAIYADHNRHRSGLFATAQGLALFRSLVLELTAKFDNRNFFLLTERFRYRKEGRIQDERQSMALDESIFDFLVSRRIAFSLVDGNREEDLEKILWQVHSSMSSCCT